MTKCDHITKVLKWGVDRSDNQAKFYVELWGCTKCDWQDKSLPNS